MDKPTRSRGKKERKKKRQRKRGEKERETFAPASCKNSRTASAIDLATLSTSFLLAPAQTKFAFPMVEVRKVRGAPPSRRNQFSATRKAGSRQLVAAATVSLSGDPLSLSLSLSDPRGIIRGLRARRSPRKKTDPPRGVEVSRVRKGCESSSCLCSCCTPWCLRGPFVSDYGFLSPGPSLHPCKEEGRKGGTGGTAGRECGRRPIKVET